MTRPERPYESDLWDAVEEAEDDGAWPPSTSTAFRDGYRVALRHALAVVTDLPVPRDRPQVAAMSPDASEAEVRVLVARNRELRTIISQAIAALDSDASRAAVRAALTDVPGRLAHVGHVGEGDAR